MSSVRRLLRFATDVGMIELFWGWVQKRLKSSKVKRETLRKQNYNLHSFGSLPQKPFDSQTSAEVEQKLYIIWLEHATPKRSPVCCNE
jgi:hypothetical protein